MIEPIVFGSLDLFICLIPSLYAPVSEVSWFCRPSSSFLNESTSGEGDSPALAIAFAS